MIKKEEGIKTLHRFTSTKKIQYHMQFLDVSPVVFPLLMRFNISKANTEQKTVS